MAILAALGGAAKRGVELRERAYDEESDTRKLILENNLEEAKRIRNENRTKKETYKNLYGGLYGILQDDGLVFDIMKRGTANAQAFLTNIQNFEQKTGIDLAKIDQQKKLGMIPDDYVPPQTLPNVDDFIQNTLIGKAGQITPPRDASGMQAAIKRHFGTTSPEAMSFQGLGQVAALTGQSIEDVSANLEGTRLKESFTSGATVSLPIDEAARLTYQNSIVAQQNEEALQKLPFPIIDHRGQDTGKTEPYHLAAARATITGDWAALKRAHALLLKEQNNLGSGDFEILTKELDKVEKRAGKLLAGLVGAEVTDDGKIEFVNKAEAFKLEQIRQAALTFVRGTYTQQILTVGIGADKNLAYTQLYNNATDSRRLTAALYTAANALSGGDKNSPYFKAFQDLKLNVNPEVVTNMAIERGIPSSISKTSDDNMFDLTEKLTAQTTNTQRAAVGTTIQKEIQTRIENGQIIVEEGITAADVMQDPSFLSKFKIDDKSIRAAINDTETNVENLQKAIDAIRSGTSENPFDLTNIAAGSSISKVVEIEQQQVKQNIEKRKEEQKEETVQATIADRKREMLKLRNQFQRPIRNLGRSLLQKRTTTTETPEESDIASGFSARERYNIFEKLYDQFTKDTLSTADNRQYNAFIENPTGFIEDILQKIRAEQRKAELD